MRIVVVAGARPNFMKVAPLIWAARNAEVDVCLVHTGRHDDLEMSQVFLNELGLPLPRHELGLHGGSREEFVAGCREALGKVFLLEKPNWVIVVGDADSTLAGALAAAELHIPLAHVEAGLRSFDREMPEEINRVETDACSDLLFVTEPAGVLNLKKEGRPPEAIHLVGNVMVDTLDCFLPLAQERSAAAKFGLEAGRFAVLTLHHPFNVDRFAHLETLCNNLSAVQDRLPVFFPVHPRTKNRLQEHRLWDRLVDLPGLKLALPQGYLDFLSVMSACRVMMTDSGGIQEETTVLGIPCLTMRDNTERPVTVERGTNRLVGDRGKRLLATLEEVLKATPPKPPRPDLWDGHAAERIIRILYARG